MSEINTQSQDAQQVSDAIESGERPAPKVDVSADYEAAQEFSTSSIDQTAEGEKAAAAATASQFEVHSANETQLAPDALGSEPTGDPDLYRDMAKDVTHGSGATGNVDDDLVQKAIELGQPGQ